MALKTIRATDSKGNNVLGVGFIGDSAYQTAVRNGYTGTETEWLESLKGDTGPQGPQGIPGPKGADGSVSFDDLTPEQKESLKGDTGERGPAGIYIGAKEPTSTDILVWINPDATQYADTTLEAKNSNGSISVIEIENSDGSIDVLEIASEPIIKYRETGVSPWQVLPLLQGPPGPKGDSYEITAADYDSIANVVLSKMTNASVVKY